MENKVAFEICKKFVSGFCDKYLESDISKLKDFCFMDLKIEPEIPEIKKLNEEYCNIIRIKEDDKKNYGLYFLDKEKNPIRKRYSNLEDCDDMNLIRAIYYILYYDKVPENKVQDLWNSLNWEDDGNNPDIYRGETINGFNTLINDVPSKKNFYVQYFKNDEEWLEKITKFRRKLFTLGNFMILPNLKPNEQQSLNCYKGFCMGDYEDRFLNAIKNKDNEKINTLIEKNKELFDFDFENFIQKNYLQDYVDENYDIDFNLPEKHFKYWEINEENREEYKQFIEKYIEEVEKRIDKRADVLIKELKEKLFKE